MPNQNGFTPLLLLLIIPLVALGISIFFNPDNAINKFRFIPNQSNVSPEKPPSPNPQDDIYELSGTEVIKISGEKRSVFFKNVQGVKEIRLGPDKTSLHFKIENPMDPKYEQRPWQCADLTDIDPALPYPQYPNPPPHEPSWDFQNFGGGYTIGACRSGYIKTGDYFIYLELKEQEASIFYEDLVTRNINSIILPPNLFQELIKENSNQEGFKLIFFRKGLNGHNYVYPREDALVVGDKLILAFHRLIIVLDLKNNKILGSKWLEQEEKVVADSFYLIFRSSLPFIIVESAWEGPPWYIYVIDIGGNESKFVSLSELKHIPYLDFDIEPYNWEENSILFNSLDTEDATKQLPNNFLDGILTWTNTQTEEKNKKAVEILMNTGKYTQVKCDLRPGMYGASCIGLKTITKYRYTSSQGLIKI